MNKTSNFLLGLVLGVTFGATLAILLAPSSGEELRGKVQSEVQRVKDEMQLAAEQKRAELEQQLEGLRAPRKAGTAG